MAKAAAGEEPHKAQVPKIVYFIGPRNEAQEAKSSAPGVNVIKSKNDKLISLEEIPELEGFDIAILHGHGDALYRNFRTADGKNLERDSVTIFEGQLSTPENISVVHNKLYPNTYFITQCHGGVAVEGIKKLIIEDPKFKAGVSFIVEGSSKHSIVGENPRACRQINIAHIIKHFIWTAARKDAAFLAYLVAIPLHCLR